MILGIETSCDETAAGIVDVEGRLHANVVASQAALHAEYGGIVPEVASRQHIRDISAVTDAALQEADCSWDDIDIVAATNGPGLAGSLLVGVNFAKGAAAAAGKPFITVNHLVGHVMAAFIMPRDAGGVSRSVGGDTADATDVGRGMRRYMALIVSGGHTELVAMNGSVATGFEFQLVGETRDDAAGEAFDKAARTLGLGYPGGPAIQKAAESADATHGIKLPRAWLGGASEFSFSGLKTAVIEVARNYGIDGSDPNADEETRATVAAIAHEFQASVVDVLVRKTINAARDHSCDGIVLVGGVAANRPLRERLIADSPLPVLVPPISLCTDNGAMIAMAGWQKVINGIESEWDADVIPSLRIG